MSTVKARMSNPPTNLGSACKPYPCLADSPRVARRASNRTSTRRGRSTTGRFGLQKIKGAQAPLWCLWMYQSNGVWGGAVESKAHDDHEQRIGRGRREPKKKQGCPFRWGSMGSADTTRNTRPNATCNVESPKHESRESKEARQTSKPNLTWGRFWAQRANVNERDVQGGQLESQGFARNRNQCH